MLLVQVSHTAVVLQSPSDIPGVRVSAMLHVLDYEMHQALHHNKGAATLQIVSIAFARDKQSEPDHTTWHAAVHWHTKLPHSPLEL